MTIRSFAKKILPSRIYKALAILKNRVPPVFTRSMSVPTMVTKSEAEFFSECARGPLPPGGTIVDLGCFMGSTAIAGPRGDQVGASGRGRCVRSLHVGRLDEWVPHARVLPTGRQLFPEARRYVCYHGDGLIKLQQADLSKYQWDGRPIALLLVDAMKSFEVARQIARSFYPALLPGRSCFTSTSNTITRLRYTCCSTGSATDSSSSGASWMAEQSPSRSRARSPPTRHGQSPAPNGLG